MPEALVSPLVHPHKATSPQDMFLIDKQQMTSAICYLEGCWTGSDSSRPSFLFGLAIELVPTTCAFLSCLCLISFVLLFIYFFVFFFVST